MIPAEMKNAYATAFKNVQRWRGRDMNTSHSYNPNTWKITKVSVSRMIIDQSTPMATGPRTCSKDSSARMVRAIR